MLFLLPYVPAVFQYIYRVLYPSFSFPFPCNVLGHTLYDMTSSLHSEATPSFVGRAQRSEVLQELRGSSSKNTSTRSDSGMNVPAEH